MTDSDIDIDDEKWTREKISDILDVIHNIRKSLPDMTLDMAGMDLTGLDLSGLDFTGAVLRQSILSYANLDCANLSNVNLFGACLDMASLIDAKLSSACLYHTYFFGAKLFGADLQGADLRFATLTGSGLQRANFDNANLNSAKLSDVNMSKATFRGASFLFTDLSRAEVGETNFQGALFSFTTLAGVDLSVAIGLDAVEHDGPSHIDIETIRQSQNSIPRQFLLGCGFTEWDANVITLFNPILNAAAVEERCDELVSERLKEKRMKRAFISYSHKDQAFVDKLCARLKEVGAVVWLDKHELLAGSLQKQVTRALSKQDIVIVVLSKDSVESDWVENELEMSRFKEIQEERDVLCPIAIDMTWQEKTSDPNNPNRTLWRKLREKLVIDFRSWKTKAFEKPFKQLIDGMAVNYEP